MKVERAIRSNNAAEFYAHQDDVFGRIASRYALLCDLFSFGIHRFWKQQRVAAIIAKESGSQLLDCATGTGDIILRVLSRRSLQPGQTMIVSNISPQMLSIARRRLSHINAVLEFQLLDAHSMPNVLSSSIDLYSISFGLKICERGQVLRVAG